MRTAAVAILLASAAAAGCQHVSYDPATGRIDADGLLTTPQLEYQRDERGRVIVRYKRANQLDGLGEVIGAAAKTMVKP